MNRLETLKHCKTLADTARLLGFKPSAVSYILYKKSLDSKYNSFEIPKKGGGVRIIRAPSSDLKKLQSRLSDLLQDCIDQINKEREITNTISHGFRRSKSIVTNALIHRNKRYVFNIDLQDFFGTINFGRVRGFFIKNRNFELEPQVATVLAQIACDENALPQGSPCSPVISNLIGHLLDIKLVQLAKQNNCIYSRYADDITFSTNMSSFPSSIALQSKDNLNIWKVGNCLLKGVSQRGFAINLEKVRMRHKNSCQKVTGLVVNKKVNVNYKYRRNVRAMTDRLLKTGSFEIEEGIEGSIEQLNGKLNFIYDTRKNSEAENLQNTNNKQPLDSYEQVYADFLFYKNFYANPLPTVLFEGKTDSIYIKCALRRLASSFPQLITLNPNNNRASYHVKFFNYSKLMSHMFKLSGHGTGDFPKFIEEYKKYFGKVSTVNTTLKPIILFIDNDSGATPVYNTIKKYTKGEVDGTHKFYPIFYNLYMVPTPKTANGQDTTIEDFFAEETRGIQISGKSFHPGGKDFNKDVHYGKYIFAKNVIEKNMNTINFDGFSPILERFNLVLQHAQDN